jgi:hypothetical protein
VSNKLFETTTALSRTFMPAELAQRNAAEGAAEALVLALKVEKLPGFRKIHTGPAKEALALGVLLSVQADEAFRKAHREFAKIIPQTPLAADGWGCTSPDCGVAGAHVREAEVVSFSHGSDRQAA